MQTTKKQPKNEQGTTNFSIKMKFTKDDTLNWETFLQACEEVDKKSKNVLCENVDTSLTFESIEEAEQYFRSIGGVTVDEFANNMKEKYGI